MEKLTPQIAALYLGQKCSAIWMPENTIENTFIVDWSVIKPLFEDGFLAGSNIVWKLNLRPLSSITESEAREVYLCDTGKKYVGTNCKHDWFDRWHLSPVIDLHEISLTPTATIKLLSFGFDLFGLIESGLAIDATKIETEKTV